MAMTMTEDVGTTLQKGLSEWWSEETEYVFQRIERWAAFARGYNRLRSQRLSRGRMTMQTGQEPRWSIASNKLIIDDSSWSPRFHNLKRSRRKSRPEETKINCCGTFNYQSNSNLDSNCLETYRYDHSIYFKTIGDIRNSKRNLQEKSEKEERVSISSEELVEWDVRSVPDFLTSQFLEDELTNENRLEVAEDTARTAAWPIVDLSKLDLNVNVDKTTNENEMYVGGRQEENNNYVEDKTTEDRRLDERTELNCNTVKTVDDEEGNSQFFNFENVRRSSRTYKQPIAEFIWPDVLLN